MNNIIAGGQNRVGEALDGLKRVYLSHSPNGFFGTKKACLGDDIHIYLGIIKEQRDCPNGIRENDKGYGIFTISETAEGLELARYYHYVTTNPKDKYHALDMEKVGYRVIKANTPEELAIKFDKYLVKFFDLVRANIANNTIYQQNTIKPEYLEVK